MIGSAASWVPTASLAAAALSLGACVTAAWRLHVWRLRARERELVQAVQEREREWAADLAACGSRASAAAIGIARLLIVAEPTSGQRLGARLANLGVEIALADSAWSACAACRDAADAGRPYNLVLLDGALVDAREAGWPDLLQAELGPWDVRVAVVRANAVPAAREAARARPAAAVDEEGCGLDENLDRGGRGGFAAAAAAMPAAVGLRSRRGE